MLVRHAFSLNLGLEAMKAWSQNLGHADVLTTLTSYGNIPAHRQGELIRALGKEAAPPGIAPPDHIAEMEALLARMKSACSPALPEAGATR